MTYKDLKIVYEDNHILVVVKPYDVPVQADESGDPDMLTMLKRSDDTLGQLVVGSDVTRASEYAARDDSKQRHASQSL